MSTRHWWSLIAALFFVIVVLTIALVALPRPAHAPTPPEAGATASSTRVVPAMVQ